MSNKMVHSSYKNKFNSIFSPYIIRFLETKEATGANVESFIHPLREFDRFAIYANLTSTCVKQTDFELWRNYITGKTASTIYHKFCIVGQFLRYMAKLGIQCYIPIYPRKPKNHYVPYIFSKDELAKIFKNADELCFIRRDFHSHIFVIPVLLRILYSTGMRIGEACNLVNSDVDMVSRTVIVRNPKNKRDRQLPIPDSLYNVLQQYIMKRNKLPIHNANNPNKPFLISLSGKPITISVSRHWFLKILEMGRIDYVPRVGPRIHDIRHTFAVHALDKLAKDGLDMHCCLPILSVTLGHKCVSDTEYYVRITNQVYPDLSETTSAISEFIFPTISKM